MFFNLFGCKKIEPEIEYQGPQGSDGLGKDAVINESAIVEFNYYYNGSIGGDNYKYDIKNHDGQLSLTYECMLYSDYGEMMMTVDDKLMSSLKELYLKYEIATWEGFSKYNPDVCDGDGFDMEITFADGKSLSCSGSNAYPDNYWYFKDDLDETMKPLIESMKEEKRQAIIAEGLSGNLNYLMVSFKQQGQSGGDSYNVFICDDDARENNFDVIIKSVSGEFIEKGEYRYYCKVANEDIGFKDFEDLIVKYDLIQWYNYDKAAVDYNNCEWFQLSFGFDDEKVLNAYGTLHPENYDEFRKDFLSLLFNKIEALSSEEKIVLYE